MKIAVISDMHLGYGEGTPREEDSYRQTEEAVDKALEEDVDLILLAGDIFDKKTPNQETLSRALKILKKPLMKKGKNVEIKEPERAKEKLSENGVPVVAIHGTHERRSKGYVNPIEMLEDAGYLVHLHCEKAVLRINGEEVAIHGLSGVPENYVKTVLSNYRPKPVPGIPNIFMFHQSLKEYIYSPENTFIEISDLPKGFDLYIDGHIHWHNILENQKTLLFPGSTVITQMRKVEAEKKKGFYLVDTENWNKEFVELETQRKFKLVKLTLNGERASEVVEKAREKLKNELEGINSPLKPLIKLKLKGRLAKGTEPSHIDKGRITGDLNALVHIDKEFETKSFRERIDHLRESQETKKSIREKGVHILRELLKKKGYDSMEPEELLSLMSKKNPNEVANMIANRFEDDGNLEKEPKNKMKKLTEF